jgi:hypothetical protein
MSTPDMNIHNFKIPKIPGALQIGCWLNKMGPGIPGCDAASLDE